MSEKTFANSPTQTAAEDAPKIRNWLITVKVQSTSPPGTAPATLGMLGPEPFKLHYQVQTMNCAAAIAFLFERTLPCECEQFFDGEPYEVVGFEATLQPDIFIA